MGGKGESSREKICCCCHVLLVFSFSTMSKVSIVSNVVSSVALVSWYQTHQNKAPAKHLPSGWVCVVDRLNIRQKCADNCPNWGVVVRF